MSIRVVGRREDEQGFFIVLFAILLVAMFLMVAVVVDLGALREDRRLSHSASDAAANAGAFSLTGGAGAPLTACETAFAYVLQNLDLPSTTSNCSARFPVSTLCTSLLTVPLGNRTATTTVGDYEISITTPVLDSDDLMDAESMGGNRTQGVNTNIDGSACDRLGVRIRLAREPFFSGIVNTGSVTTDIHSVAVRNNDTTSVPISLIIMEPTGCPAIAASGTGSIEVVQNTAAGQTTNIGGIMVISDGTTCPNNDYTLNVGSGATQGHISVLTKDASNNFNGVIYLRALATSGICTQPACDPAQFSASTGYFPRPKRQPVPLDRGLVDYKYNCRANYRNTGSDPNYRFVNQFGSSGTELPACSGENVTSPESDYMNEFYRAVTAGALEPQSPVIISDCSTLPATLPGGAYSDPSFFNFKITCNPPNNFNLTVTGNIWFAGNQSLSPGTVIVNGNAVFNQGISIGNGNLLEVRGNSQFKGTIGINGGGVFRLKGNPTGTACTVPGEPGTQFVSSPTTCTRTSSSNAAMAFLSSTVGALDQNGGLVDLQHVMLYADNGPVLKLGGNGGISWSPPTEGPFKQLALWSDKVATSANGTHHSIAGGGTINLGGVYFSPTGWFEITGNSDISPQTAQFWTGVLQQNGGATFKMTPDGSNIGVPVALGTTLIR